MIRLQRVAEFRPSHSAVSGLILVILLAFSGGLCSAQQQTYVGQFDVYTGFSNLNSPGLNNLNQVGFNLQVGANINRWLATGFDYSIQSGNTILTTNLATPALQAQLGALALQYIEAGIIPPTYQLRLPLHAVTNTFTYGGQLMYRHFAHTTLFIRPALSAFRITATPHPTDPFAAAVSTYLAPQGSLTDWTGSYGLGGGGEYNFSKHVGIRLQMDAEWNHPFNSILANGFWSYRYSVGPTFHLGPNVPAH
jgi:hypothetical protein